jgi:hypothetical protein
VLIAWRRGAGKTRGKARAGWRAERPGRPASLPRALEDFETIAHEVSGLGQRVSDLEERLVHVEKVNTGLEEAALTTARAPCRRYQRTGTRCTRQYAANQRWSDVLRRVEGLGPAAARRLSRFVADSGREDCRHAGRLLSRFTRGRSLVRSQPRPLLNEAVIGSHTPVTTEYELADSAEHSLRFVQG